MPPSLAQLDRTTPAGRLRIVATDGELLHQATKRGDADALAELFARHAEMVWHVCKQVLWREDDCEDAFQATFLILLRKASAIRSSDSAGGWLYRVAYRTAVAARRKRSQRKMEPLVGDPPQPEPEFPDFENRYHTTILLEELAALPAKYQQPLVMRYLEGRSRREIADQTDSTLAAVQGYLARGKQLLRGRLLRRGVLLSTGMAALTTTQAAHAAPAVLTAAALPLLATVASGAPGALTKISASTLELANQGARSMVISTLLTKPVVWVAVAFAAARVAANHQPAGGAAQEAGVVLEEAGSGQPAEGREEESLEVIQLAAAPVERPIVEAPVVEAPVVEAKPVEAAAPVVERPVPQVEIIRDMLKRQNEIRDFQQQRLEKLKEAVNLKRNRDADSQSRAEVLQLEGEVLQAEIQAIQMELEMLKIQQSQIDVVNRPHAPTTPPVPVSSNGLLSPGQTISIQFYSESSPDPEYAGGRGREMGGRGITSFFPEGRYAIEPTGTIPLGPKYGRVKVVGMSLEEAEEAVAKKFREETPDVKVQITLPTPAKNLGGGQF